MVFVDSDIVLGAWTTFNVRVLYSCYDITSSLVSGPNVVGAWLGNGQWIGIWSHTSPQPSQTLRLQMNVLLDDDSVLSVSSDTTWASHTGPIISSDIVTV
jgi:alpha-L-rhamnosidase